MSELTKLTEKDGIPVYLHDEWKFDGCGGGFEALVFGVYPDKKTILHSHPQQGDTPYLIKPLTFMHQPLDYDKYRYKFPGQQVPDGVVWSEFCDTDGVWNKIYPEACEEEFLRCPIADYCEDCERPKRSCSCDEAEYINTRMEHWNP
jgi:hypothetical protein